MKDFLKALVFGGLFAVPFLTLYVENDYFFPFITGKNFWFRIIIDVTVAAWVLLALYDVKYRPKFSWIFSSFSILLIVMFFANLFGEHPTTSFWSNFERMDGYVSLVHTFLYMVVLGSVLRTKKDWQYLLNTSLVVSFIVALNGLAQYFGLKPGSSRIDSTLGNAAYMAVYMLFHIFVAFWLFVETKRQNAKIVYAFLALMFTFVLIETGTRGTAVGLAVGVLVMVSYIGLFGKQFKDIRKYAIGTFVILLLAVGGFVLGRDSAFIQSNPNLARIANISIDDLAVRGTIWGMAWEGVKDRPLLGWGQGNFNFVFNQYYEPALYAQEQWFDRSHNIIFDWLIAGGILGFLAYFSIFGACLYYLFIRPLLRPEDESFTVLERAVLLGILAGYLTHNFVVFDNIVSYIFFAIILALIHSRVSTPIVQIEKTQIDTNIITQFATPVVVVLVIGVVYLAHAPNIGAAKDIINAMRSQAPEQRLEYFKSAVDRNSFAHQEITEQLAQTTMGVVREEAVSEETKQAYAMFTEEQLRRLATEKPTDARVHVFAGSYYRAIGQYEKAAEHMARARELSPRKPSIVIQQGFIALSQGATEEAFGFFKEAYDLEPANPEAREYYAVALIQAGRSDEAIALMDTDVVRDRFAQSDFLLGVANDAGLTDFMIQLMERRLELLPNTDGSLAQRYASLAFLYYQKGDTENAIRALEVGKDRAPSFTAAASCIIDNIRNNRNPDTPCS